MLTFDSDRDSLVVTFKVLIFFSLGPTNKPTIPPRKYLPIFVLGANTF